MQPVIESNLTSMAWHIEVNLSLVCFKSRYFSQVCPKRDDLVGLWRWCVGFIWPFSPSFTSLVFFVACHIWPEQELWLWPSQRSSPWKLTAEISQSWNIFVFRSLKSCFEAPMSPLFTGESKSKTTDHLKFLFSWLDASISCIHQVMLMSNFVLMHFAHFLLIR